MDLVKSVKCGFHVASKRTMIVGVEKGMNGSKVWLCADGKPTNATNETLVGFLVTNLIGRHVVSLKFRYDIYR